MSSLLLKTTIRGYHVYRAVWEPRVGESFVVLHESGNEVFIDFLGIANRSTGPLLHMLSFCGCRNCLDRLFVNISPPIDGGSRHSIVSTSSCLRMLSPVANNFQLLAKTVRSIHTPRYSLLFFVALLTGFRSRTRGLYIGGLRALFLWPPYRTLWTSQATRHISQLVSPEELLWITIRRKLGEEICKLSPLGGRITGHFNDFNALIHLSQSCSN